MTGFAPQPPAPAPDVTSDVAVETASRRASRVWMRALTWLACVVVLWFVGKALLKQIRMVEWSQVHFRAVPALAATLCTVGVSVAQLYVRRTLLIAYGYPVPWRVQIPVTWVAQLGKYIPGGVASVGGAMVMLRRHGVPGAVAFSVAVLLDGLAVMAGLIVSAPLLVSQPVRERLPDAWIVGAAMIAGGLVALHPKVFVGLLNVALRKVRRQPIQNVPPLHRYLWPVLCSFAQWLFAGMGLWFMTRTITDVRLAQIPLFVASAALAMTVSYLMPFAPGGIGIREGIYVVTLKSVVGPEVAIVALAMRVIQTIVELVLAGVGVWVMRKSGD
jgi:uncharacterized membrane protein YbhN (UPF0104 family)